MEESDGKRLKEWRKMSGYSQKALGVLLGRSQGYIGDIEAGRTGLSRDLLARLLERTNVNAGFLLTGIGPMVREETDQAFVAPSGNVRVERSNPTHPLAGDFSCAGEEYSLIRRFDVDVSAGHGIIPVEDGQAENVAFSRSWLLRHHINADLCGLVKVRGDSMSPTIPDGALALVHRPEMTVQTEGVYAFSRGGEAFIKRLAPISIGDNGKPAAILIISDNPAYPPETVSGPELNEMRIAGRVRSYIVSL